MIKANELKPGNLIWFKNPVTNDEKRFVTIDAVKQSFNSFQEKHDHGIDIWLPLSYCDPIPLTSEWLERCEFVIKHGASEEEPLTYAALKMDLDIAKEEDGYYLRYECQDAYYDSNIGRKIEYVHQLQNIYLDLTGEELNVKL